MSIDFKYQQDGGFFDIAFEDKGIVETDGFDSAIVVSLFTDQRAPESVQPDPMRRRGWIGDLGEIDKIGSRFWFLEQSRITTATLNGFIDHAKTALAWLVEDGLAKNIAISGSLQQSAIVLRIVITAISGKTTIITADAWNKTIL